MIQRITFTLSLYYLLSLASFGQDTISDKIRLNQIGYYPDGPKKAVLVDSIADQFYIVSTNFKDTLFRGKIKPSGKWEFSEETVSQADFSSLKAIGSYIMAVPGVGYSYTFDIKPMVHFEAARASVKSYYYQRASTAITKEHGGTWSRKAGHMDTTVFIHPSAASKNRLANTTISSSQGWYDAGDYNKYIVNSGISTYTLLSLYEDFPKYFDTLKLNIPESKNKIPDLLDEILWNVRWMLTMQDPDDGGVYHKLTNANFDGSVMPEYAINKRYVVKKGTAATLDFAAVMAQSARVFAKFKKEMPGFSDKCLAASKKAYAWAKKNPEVEYKNGDNTDPRIVTGEYGDGNFKDEFQWAAMELFVTTGNTMFYEDANLPSTLENGFSVPAWSNVNTLGLITLNRYKGKFTGKEGINISAVSDKLVKMASALKNNAEQSPYGVPMGIDKNDFVWGSNSTAANQGNLLIQAYLITKDQSFLDAALANLDYLMGRNATGYSFLTGYGEKSTFNPHHRPSEADRIKEPVPGFLAGGPNPGQQDLKDMRGRKYPSSLPAKSYTDVKESYASNEIAINWNAPYAYLSFAIEVLYSKK